MNWTLEKVATGCGGTVRGSAVISGVEVDSRRVGPGMLFVALRGRGAFRYFKATVRRLGIADDWYAFRDQAFEEIAVAWCEDNGIAFARG